MDLFQRKRAEEFYLVTATRAANAMMGVESAGLCTDRIRYVKPASIEFSETHTSMQHLAETSEVICRNI